MPITPDTKDWTWVLARRCPECGYEAHAFARADVAPMVRANADTWAGVLVRPGVEVRPTDDRWSPLEYGCHIRDVFRVMTGRVDLILAEPDPQFPNWDQDETAAADGYATQDPARVTADLQRAAAGFAQRFEGLTDEQWARPGRRSDGAVFTLDSLSRYALHDVIHHLVDVPALDDA